MKILKNIINWTVWTLLGLYALVMVIIHIPAAQDYLARKAGAILSERLGTKVSIGRVDLGFMNRLILDDVHLWDQQQKEMLKAARLSVRLSLLPLAEGKIDVSSAQVFGAHIKLYKATESSPLNCQFVIDSLASKDTTSHTPLDLRIGSLIMRHSSVAYDNWSVARLNGKFSPHHIYAQNISAHVILKALTDDSLNINMKRLSLTEQSGLDIKRLSFHLEAGRRNATLQDWQLQLATSQLNADSISATYDVDQFKETLRYKCVLSSENISTSELAIFVPQLKHYNNTFSIATELEGTAHSLDIGRLQIASADGDLSLTADGNADWSGYANKNSEHPDWHLKIGQLHVGNAILKTVSEHFVELPAPLLAPSFIELAGTFGGTKSELLNADADINTDIGSATAILTLDADRKFSGKVTTDSIDIRKLTGQEQIGRLSANLQATGRLIPNSAPAIEAKGTISAIGYDGIRYNNIDLSASYADNNLKGWLKIDDERVKAEVEGDITGTTANDMVGTVSLHNLLLPEKQFSLNYLKIESGFEEGSHFLTLNSDFAHAELRGEFDYATLPQSITNQIGDKLPTLPGLPPVNREARNNFSLHLTMADTKWAKSLLGTDITIHAPMTLSATINDHNRLMTVDSHLPAFNYNGGSYSGGSLHVNTPQDSIVLQAQLTKAMTNGEQLELDLHANAANNNLTTSFAWDNHSLTMPMSGRFNTTGRLYRNTANQPEAHVVVLPSQVSVNGEQWTVETSDLIYSTNRLLVDHFMIHNGNQHITIDGLASTSPRDTLVVDLNDVEVAYILDLVDFTAVSFSGQASGRAYLSEIFGNPSAHANLTVGHFLFEKGRMGTLTANVAWNKKEKQIDIHATANDGPDAMTYINGYVSPERDYIDLAISGQGTHIDFMHSFTESFLSGIDGHAYGDLRLHGPLSTIQLTGTLVIDGQATVTPLGTTYTLRRDTVVMVPDEIGLQRVPVYDKYGNIAFLSGGIHHQHLTNLTFDLDVETDNLLGYDFSSFGDQSFYGTVFAGGKVSIEGRPGRVTIDCDVTPQKGTVFTYNAAQADAIANREFITWKKQAIPHPNAPDTQGETEDGTAVSSGSSTNIYMNFLINTTPEPTMRLLMDARTGDYITLNGSGVLRATYYNKGTFNMFGTYTVEHGTYDITIQNIIKKKFTFQPGGTIVFGGDPYDAALQLQALYTVQGVSLSDLNIGNSFSQNTIRVNCLMNITGQPKAPHVEFDLDMPTVNADEKQMVRSVINGQQEMNQQVLYLLGIGRFYSQGQNNSDQQQQDQTSLAMQSFLSGALSSQINSVLSSVVKNNDWNLGANIATGTEGWNNAEYEGIVNGRMLNNRLLINGQFGYRDKATQANPSFIGDFDISYLLYPNGNLALKVYNQTNDRYFTRSSLNTQGIGIIMKKDFNKFKDLFRKSQNLNSAAL